MLKGTGKQVAWAEDIMNIARETVNSNIKAIKEQQEKYNGQFRKDELEAYERVGQQLEAMFSKVTEASQIINMRSRLTGAFINEMVQEYVNMMQIKRVKEER